MGSFSTVNGAMVHAHVYVRMCVHVCACATDRGEATEEEQGSSCLLRLFYLKLMFMFAVRYCRCWTL